MQVQWSRNKDVIETGILIARLVEDKVSSGEWSLDLRRIIPSWEDLNPIERFVSYYGTKQALSDGESAFKPNLDKFDRFEMKVLAMESGLIPGSNNLLLGEIRVYSRIVGLDDQLEALSRWDAKTEEEKAKDKKTKTWKEMSLTIEWENLEKRKERNESLEDDELEFEIT